MGGLPVVRSARQSKTINALFAVVMVSEGIEGIVRRDTPIGTQPWITDDRQLAEEMLMRAREAWPVCYLARFERRRDHVFPD